MHNLFCCGTPSALTVVTCHGDSSLVGGAGGLFGSEDCDRVTVTACAMLLLGKLFTLVVDTFLVTVFPLAKHVSCNM